MEQSGGTYRNSSRLGMCSKGIQTCTFPALECEKAEITEETGGSPLPTPEYNPRMPDTQGFPLIRAAESWWHVVG